MGISLIVLSQVIIMFLLIGVGFFCYKIKMINEKSASQLSDILLLIVTPALIINAFQIKFKAELLKGLLISLSLAILSIFIGIIISIITIRKKPDNNDYKAERMACVYSNSGFMGIPLIQAVLPGNGVFFASIYIAIFNVFVWTHGVTVMKGSFTKKDIKKVVLSAPIISVIIGILLFVLQIKLPDVIGSTIGYIADLNTPLAMIITGIYIAKSNLLTAFTDKKIYKVVIIRLLLIPLIMVSFFMFFNITEEFRTIMIANLIATACPTAAVTLLFATKFKSNPEYASKIIAVTTLFSIITIPLIMLIMDKTAGMFAII